MIKKSGLRTGFLRAGEQSRPEAQGRLSTAVPRSPGGPARCVAMQCNAMQCNAMQCNAMQPKKNQKKKPKNQKKEPKKNQNYPSKETLTERESWNSKRQIDVVTFYSRLRKSPDVCIGMSWHLRDFLKPF